MFVEGAYKKIASFFNLKRKIWPHIFQKKYLLCRGETIKGVGLLEEGVGFLAPPLLEIRGAPGLDLAHFLICCPTDS